MTDQPLDPADAALVAALREDAVEGDLLTLPELAQQAQVSLPLLEALVREGLLTPRATGPIRLTLRDAQTVRAGLALVDAGLPLDELLELARRTDDAMRAVAEHAVELFLRFVRDPVRGTSPDEDEAADRLVTAFHTMLPATEQLVGQHFRQLLIAQARARLEQELAQEAQAGER